MYLKCLTQGFYNVLTEKRETIVVSYVVLLSFAANMHDDNNLSNSINPYGIDEVHLNIYTHFITLLYFKIHHHIYFDICMNDKFSNSGKYVQNNCNSIWNLVPLGLVSMRKMIQWIVVFVLPAESLTIGCKWILRVSIVNPNQSFALKMSLSSKRKRIRKFKIFTF